MRKWPTFSKNFFIYLFLENILILILNKDLSTILTFMAIPSTSYRNTMVWWGLNGVPYKKIDNILYWEKETINA